MNENRQKYGSKKMRKIFEWKRFRCDIEIRWSSEYTTVEPQISSSGKSASLSDLPISSVRGEEYVFSPGAIFRYVCTQRQLARARFRHEKKEWGKRTLIADIGGIDCTPIAVYLLDDKLEQIFFVLDVHLLLELE